MKLIQLTKAMPHQGLSEGDVLSVDQRSAQVLIKRGDATEYEPSKEQAEKVETIDDIESTAKRGRAVMTTARVGFADPGPVAASTDEAEDAPAAEADAAADPAPEPLKRSPKRGPAASGAQPAGGDAGGGVTE